MAPKTIPKLVEELSEAEAAAEPKRFAAEIAGHDRSCDPFKLAKGDNVS
jgi:hypothetical protein